MGIYTWGLNGHTESLLLPNTPLLKCTLYTNQLLRRTWVSRFMTSLFPFTHLHMSVVRALVTLISRIMPVPQGGADGSPPAGAVVSPSLSSMSLGETIVAETILCSPGLPFP